ncbi:unnamed protein product, partial [Didymodactylos carnosus]
DLNVQVYRVVAWYPFPRYDPWGDPADGNITRNDNDLILLKLEKPARLTQRVQPISLPEPMHSFNSQCCIVSGFGVIKESRHSTILKYLTVPLVDRDECARGHRPKRIKDFHICAGFWSGGSDACSGDSGGPLACYDQSQNGSRPILAGVVSWGIRCALEKTYGVYTRVSRYVTWIHNTIRNN